MCCATCGFTRPLSFKARSTVPIETPAAAAISFKEHVETGKNHGVYLNGVDGNVKCCLQKKSESFL